MKFLIVNGPNVNLMRCPVPGLPGGLDYDGLMDWLSGCCAQMGIETDFFQSNHEGDLIDRKSVV